MGEKRQFKNHYFFPFLSEDAMTLFPKHCNQLIWLRSSQLASLLLCLHSEDL